MKVAVVFPIYNGLSFTKVCLDSLIDSKFEDSKIQLSIVVTDDGSTDGSFEWIKSHYPQVHVLKGNGNLWWTGGINKAIEYAIEKLETDYIIWWNNDIVADKDYFTNLAHILNSNDTNTIVGSKIYMKYDKNRLWSMGGYFDPYVGDKGMIGSGEPDGEDFNQVLSVDWLPGMGTITHKSIYNEIGFLDESVFPQYHGDSDYTYSAKLKGYKIIVYPNLKIYNDLSHSGLKHQDSFFKLVQSLFSLKSNYNIKKDMQFYHRHSNSSRAYLILVEKYVKYIGGFVKWKVKKIFGKSRN